MTAEEKLTLIKEKLQEFDNDINENGYDQGVLVEFLNWLRRMLE